MAQINIYVPDRLRDRVKAAGINVSRICQDALEVAVRFKEQQGVPGDTIRLQGPLPSGGYCPPGTMARTPHDHAACQQRWPASPSPTWEQVCPHPRHDRTPYGVCRACGQKVDP
jgi:hypothetical protein